jgi:hypothetical protein
MQFSSAKKGAQNKSFSCCDDSLGTKSTPVSGEPVRSRITAGGTPGAGVNVAAKFGRGDNDGFQSSPRKKAW